MDFLTPPTELFPKILISIATAVPALISFGVRMSARFDYYQDADTVRRRKISGTLAAIFLMLWIGAMAWLWR